MSEKLFILCQDDLGNYEIRYDDKVFHFLWEVAPILNEQQATINELEKNYDDLVNWVSEIAKRNVVLDEQIGQLQRENEQLRKELDNFKPVMFQDVRKGTVILYSKGDIDE